VASATIADGVLTLSLRTWDKIFSVHGSLHIPLEHISDVSSGPAPAVPILSKVIGTNMPGVLAAGTFFDSHGLLFYDYGADAECLILDVDHERFHRVVVEIDAPQTAAAVVQHVKAAIAAPRATSS
jgi:hypothetical protein